MKRLLTVGILVAILVIGSVGITAAAAPPSSRGTGVVMESGQGYLTSGSGGDSSAFFYYQQVAHVSLTVFPGALLNSEQVRVKNVWAGNVPFADVAGGSIFAKTVEFDSTNWQIELGTSRETSVEYYYTVTYPGTK